MEIIASSSCLSCRGWWPTFLDRLLPLSTCMSSQLRYFEPLPEGKSEHSIALRPCVKSRTILAKAILLSLTSVSSTTIHRSELPFHSVPVTPRIRPPLTQPWHARAGLPTGSTDAANHPLLRQLHPATRSPTRRLVGLTLRFIPIYGMLG